MPTNRNSKSILHILLSPRMLVALLMGFASGLPLLLTISVLQAWMKDAGIDLTVIGFMTLVQSPYTWKFLWAPFLDHFTLPFLGRRRGWLFVAQIALIISIVILGFSDPVGNFMGMIVAAVLVAFFSATQDIVIDAYRREDLSDEELGWEIFFIGSTVVAIPGMLLLFKFAPWNSKNNIDETPVNIPVA